MLTTLLGAAALGQRGVVFRKGQRNAWGRDHRDAAVELLVCLNELLAWVSLWRAVDRNWASSDSQVLWDHTAVGLCALGALGTILDIDSDSIFDTIRRLAAVSWGISLDDPVTILLAGLGIIYRLRFGMGVVHKANAWGLPFSQQSSDPHQAERPLNVLFLSVGTRGDVQPFIHLGQELKVRGHGVTICALGKYRGIVERNGLAFRSAGIEDIEESTFWRRCRHVSEVMADQIPDFCLNFLTIGTALYQATLASKADVLIVTSTAQSMALSISNKLSIPTFVVKFAPDMPTRAFPAPGYESKTKLVFSEAIANLTTWYLHWLRIGLASVKCKFGEVENKYRHEVLGLGPLVGGARLREMGDCPNLCAFSEVVVPTPRDWPGNALVTGWWLPLKPQRRHSYAAVSSEVSSVSPSSSSSSVSASTSDALDEIEEEISDEVLHFLGSKKDVICVTFGSMSPTANALGLVPLVLKACESVFGSDGKVLIVGNRFQQFTHEGRVMVIDEAPYHKLFPLVRLVVHHGGAGTCASTLETCTLSLIVPMLLWTDQSLWACQLEKLDVAVHVEQRFAFCESDQERVELEARFRTDCESGLRKLAQDSSDPKHCAMRETVAKLVDAERGVEKAADAIEFVMRSRPTV